MFYLYFYMVLQICSALLCQLYWSDKFFWFGKIPHIVMLCKQLLKWPVITQAVTVCSNNLHTSSILEAARKGTRMKAEAKKKAAKKEVVKKVFIPYQKRLEMEQVGKISPRIDDSGRSSPIDDVYFRFGYKWPIYSITEAIEMHRETQHPTQLNNPTADLIAHVELSMSANKKNHYVDGFSNVILFPHLFHAPHERTILAICKDEEMVESMKQMEVTLALGPEAVKMADKGDLDFKLYDHIICHSSLLPNLISIRGLLKKRFPSPKIGTAGVDLMPLATRFLKGVQYQAIKDKYDHDFAKIDIKIGTLEMESEQIEDNVRALVAHIESNRTAARTANLVTLITLRCATSQEWFKIDHTLYIPMSESEGEQQEINL